MAEMIANARPWHVASPEDRDFKDYLMDRAILLDILPVSDDAYSLFTKIFSPRPERRLSLDDIRAEVLAMDTFFLTDREAFTCGWAGRLKEKMQRKMGKCGVPSIPSRRSESSSGWYLNSSEDSSSGSHYSSGSSSSAFNSTSLESSAPPATPPAPAVEAFYSMDKAVGHVELAAAFHLTC